MSGLAPFPRRVLVRHGTVVDGLSAQPRRADILVADGIIAAIDPQISPDPDVYEIDARGQYVTPGLIDVHIHAEAALLNDPVPVHLLSQGVTTVIIGQDGCSFSPGTGDTLDYMRRYFASVNGALPEGIYDGGSVADFLALFDGRVAVNVAYLVPHGNVRMEVMGPGDRLPTDAELARMTALLSDGLADGAVGLSTGLEYIPSQYASAHELALLCRPLVEAGGVFVTHMRGYGDAAVDALDEICSVASLTDVRMHISHLRGPARSLTAAIDDAADAGADISFDSYPYTATCTTLAATLLPSWAQEGGIETTKTRLTSGALRSAVHSILMAKGTQSPLRQVMISAVRPGPNEWTAGMRLGEASLVAKKNPAEFVCDLLLDEELNVGAIRFTADGDGFADENSRSLMKHGAHMGGSDGIFVGSHPHPRGWGAFARYLGTHVRELGDLSWTGAISHLASNPAQRFGLTNRGVLRQGASADIAVFDPTRIADMATYHEPKRLATGVSCVLINGIPALLDGKPTMRTPGRVLRRDGSSA